MEYLMFKSAALKRGDGLTRDYTCVIGGASSGAAKHR